jgi:hypothetical protein
MTLIGCASTTFCLCTGQALGEAKKPPLKLKLQLVLNEKVFQIFVTFFLSNLLKLKLGGKGVTLIYNKQACITEKVLRKEI